MRWIWWVVAIAIVVCFGELTSRLDDWIFQSIPFLANPDREYDLVLNDAHGVRGRPNGRFKKYQLNAFGFRGPEIGKEKPAAVPRVMILGASETFGLYESEGHEYPALLSEDLAKQGHNVEVINAAVAGMTLPSIEAFWKNWAKEFKPDLVVIYPSPMFYLDNELPRPATPNPAGQVAPGFRSRFFERLKDSAKQWTLLKEVRNRFVLWRALRGKDESFLFDDVPADRREAFSNDLTNLVKEIQNDGAKVALVTHAFKAGSELTATDDAELQGFRIFFPRAVPKTMAAFEATANVDVDKVAAATGAKLIDAAAELSGQRKLFADPVHFNDAGSRAMAEILARGIAPLLPPAKEAR